MLCAVDTDGHLARIAQLREQAADQLKGKIIAVASDKGGIGKTTLAVELAYCLGAVLVDGDWHEGNASRSLGWRHEERVNSPFLAAIEAGRVPRPIKGGRAKPDLVPSGPDLEDLQPGKGVTAKALVEWAAAWQRPIVVDTHPGGGPVANDACAEAHVIVTTAPLSQKDLAALDGWSVAMDGYPLMVVPNKVPRVPPASQTDWLERIATRQDIPVATPIPFSYVFERRIARTALCSSMRTSVNTEPLVDAFIEISTEVLTYAAGTV
jgi:chromosome partitioning protein